MILSWEYKKTNNPQIITVKHIKEAQMIKNHVKRSVPELEPTNFKTEETDNGKI